MTKAEHASAIADLRPILNKLYRAIEQYGPISAPELRKPLALEEGDRWPGRKNGTNAGTENYRALMGVGLIKIDAKRGYAGAKATTYVATDINDVEHEARRYRRSLGKNQGTKKRDTDVSKYNQRIAAYREEEKRLGTSARAHWIQKRRRVIELAQELRRIEPMIYWKAVPDNELEQVWDEITSLINWGEQVESSIDLKRADKELREKIATLRNTQGRGELEAAAFHRKADKLEAELEDKINNR